MVQSAGPDPGLHEGPVEETSMYHSPSPVMFIWYFAPIVFASSVLRPSAAGSVSLKSCLISTAISVSSEVNHGSVSAVPPGYARRQGLGLVRERASRSSRPDFVPRSWPERGARRRAQGALAPLQPFAQSPRECRPRY